jgi:hypothetical protein
MAFDQCENLGRSHELTGPREKLDESEARVGKVGRECFRLLAGEPECRGRRRLTVARRLVDAGSTGCERYSEAAEELATVGRSGRQNQALHRDHARSSLTKRKQNNTLARLCPKTP